MYRKHHSGQLSIEEFHLPFGGMLDPDNRWVKFSALMPWVELEEAYATQFNPTTGAPAKPVRVAFGALFIKQRLGLTDEETVEFERILTCSFSLVFRAIRVSLHSTRP
jgi:IS5 family transposase